jgi:hypothetical protein
MIKYAPKSKRGAPELTLLSMISYKREREREREKERELRECEKETKRVCSIHLEEADSDFVLLKLLQHLLKQSFFSLPLPLSLCLSVSLHLSLSLFSLSLSLLCVEVIFVSAHSSSNYLERVVEVVDILGILDHPFALGDKQLSELGFGEIFFHFIDFIL